MRGLGPNQRCLSGFFRSTNFFLQPQKRDTINSTEKIRGIYTVGWNYHRKSPNTVEKTNSRYYFSPQPPIFSQLCQFSSDFDVSYGISLISHRENPTDFFCKVCLIPKLIWVGVTRSSFTRSQLSFFTRSLVFINSFSLDQLLGHFSRVIVYSSQN